MLQGDVLQDLQVVRCGGGSLSPSSSFPCSNTGFAALVSVTMLFVWLFLL